MRGKRLEIINRKGKRRPGGMEGRHAVGGADGKEGARMRMITFLIMIHEYVHGIWIITCGCLGVLLAISGYWVIGLSGFYFGKF